MLIVIEASKNEDFNFSVARTEHLAVGSTWIIAVVRLQQARIFRKTTSVMKSLSLIALASLSFATLTSTAQVTDAGPDTLICDGTYTMQASAVPAGGTGTWFQITGCGTIIDPASAVTLVFLCPGENTLVWEVNDNGSISTDTVFIGVVDLPTIANAGPDQTIVGPPFSAQLTANTPTFPSYCHWTVVSGAGVITNPSDPNTSVSGLSVGLNVFMWTCFTGPCVNSDVISVNAFVWTGIGSATTEPTPVFCLDTQLGQLRLNGSGKVDGLTLTDIQGRAMELQQVGADHAWSTAYCVPGLYIVRAMVDDQLVSLRFVLDH